MSPKLILALGVVALLLYVGFSYRMRTQFPRIDVEYDTAVTGRISSSFQMGRAHYFLLNGKAAARYDFTAFTPARPADGQPAGEPLSQANNLGEYLHRGDSIRKDARSTELTVWRGQRLSQWVCPPAEARP